jgi:4-hydroxy-3-methylbut-2-enyl diphosphate reductase
MHFVGWVANPRGFCAGVDRAIAIVERALAMFGRPIYVRHEVVHNRFVVDDLKAKGAIFIEDLEDVPEGATLIYSAHGVPQSVCQEAQARGFRVFDATCPLVTKVHVEVRSLHAQGYDIIMIGHEGHPEVEGTMGQVSSGMHLVQNEEDARCLELPQCERVAYVSQTTLSVDETRRVIDLLRERFPNIRGPRKDDICYATQNRQDAVRGFRDQVDMVLVVGSSTSSNSRRLQELAEGMGIRSYLVDDPNQLAAEWFSGVSRVGVTAGASAPDVLVQEIIEAARSLMSCDIDMIEMNGIEEHMYFALPPELREPKEEAHRS